MFNWDQDPKRTERGIQALLKRRFPGLQSFDGGGGDGGQDAALITRDGHTVFEVKSFGRLTASRRRQVERSVNAAVKSAPNMTRWVLVIPMNMTPRRPGVKSSEQSWFEETLPRLAPGVDLDWFGLDWLDGALAENMDVQRYIEGAESQVLQRAKEFGLEQAVLADGSTDLDIRLAGLRRRVDEVSPYWTLDFAVRDGVRWQTLRAKSEDAPIVDPITFTPTVAFKVGDEEDERLRAKLEKTLAFGGHIDLPAGYVTDIDIDASEEARKLFRTDDPSTSEFSFTSARETLERRIRCRYQVLAGDDVEASGVPASVGAGGESVLSEFSVFLSEKTAGSVGATLYGSDAAGIVTVEIGLPRPPSAEARDVSLLETASLHLTLPDSIVGSDIDSLLPVVRTLAAAQAGTRIRVMLPDLGYVAGRALDDAPFPGAAETHQLVADLHRMQAVMGSVFTFPASITDDDVDELRRAVRQIDGEDILLEGGVTLQLRPDALGGFLETLRSAPDNGLQGGLFAVSELIEFDVGDLRLVYGPSAFWAPHPKLVNLAELEGVAAGEAGSVGDGETVPAVFEPSDTAFRWFSCQRSATYLETGERPIEPGD